MKSIHEPLSYLFVCDGVGLGGLEMQMVARGLDALQRGERAALATSRKGLWQYAKQSGLDLHDIDFRISYLDPFAIKRLAKLMKRAAANICVVGQSHLLSQVLAARKLAKLPIAVVFYQQMQSGHPKRDWFHDRIYSSLDATIVLTQQMKQELIRTTVMPAERIFVIPYGVRAGQFMLSEDEKKSARQLFGIPETAFVIGCIGRLDPQKDQMLLLDAFARSALPEQRILVLAGDATPGSEAYASALRQKAQRLGITDRTLFLPFTKAVPKLLACLDVFVLPSRSETFGLVVIEAMAAGAPVVATAAGGVSEIIENERTGLLFQPGDDGALAAHLSKLAGEAALRESLGREARRVAKERFDYDKQTEEFFKVCRGVFFNHKVRQGGTKVHEGRRN